MEIEIYICIAGTSIASMYFFARLKTGERPFNPGTVILHLDDLPEGQTMNRDYEQSIGRKKKVLQPWKL